jgi:hypothetical protein
MPGLSVCVVGGAAVVMDGIIAVMVQSMAMAWESFFEVGMMAVLVKEQSILYESVGVGLLLNVTADVSKHDFICVVLHKAVLEKAQIYLYSGEACVAALLLFCPDVRSSLNALE